MNLIPAYGRDYKSRAAVLADLKAGKDFLTVGWGPQPGKVINLPQILAEPGGDVLVRCRDGRKVVVFKRSELE